MISKEEYLKLLESAKEEDYDIDGPCHEETWIPSEPLFKKKTTLPTHGVIDVLKYRKEQIQDALYKAMNIHVGEFIIQIKSYSGHPKDEQFSEPLTLNIRVMQEQNKIVRKLDVFRDTRFANQPWISYFESSGYAQKIPVATMVDIIRWMQALHRMSAFL